MQALRNIDQIRRNNRLDILCILSQNSDINRSALSEMTGLTNASITKIIAQMETEGILYEVAGFSKSRNRKSKFLQLIPSYFYGIVFYIGRKSISVGLLDLQGNLIKEKNYPLTIENTSSQSLQELVPKVINDISDTIPVGGICFVSPGTMGTQTDHKGPYYWLQESLEIPIKKGQQLFLAADNDSNIAALGELWYGSGGKLDSFVLYSVGHGIGAAVCSKGKILSSTHGINTEIGHITINLNGPQCSCGNHGCLEIYGSINRLEKDFCKTFKEDNMNNCDLNIKTLIQKSEEGDKKAEELLNNYNETLAEGGLILANMFGPQKIIIAPNEINTLDTPTLPAKIQSVIQNRSFLYRKKSFTVEYSSLGSQIHFKGGLALLINSLILESSK